MALPPDVITAELTYGPLTDFVGDDAPATSVTITADADLVWAETGQPLLRSPLPIPPGLSGSIELPATDQPGFITADGVVTGWTYTARMRVQGQTDRTVTFQLPTLGLSGQVFDLDTMIAVAPGVVVDPVPWLDDLDSAVEAAAGSAADANTSADAAAASVTAAAAQAAAAAASATAAAGSATAAGTSATSADGSATSAAGSATSAAASLAAMPPWWFGTQVAYDAIPVKDPATMYFING